MKYFYDGANDELQPRHGEVDAASEDEAKQKIKERGVTHFKLRQIPDKEIIHVESQYGVHSKQPSVVMFWKEHSLRMSPEEARVFAAGIIEASTTAESDGFIVEFLTEEMGMPMADVGMVLKSFRDWKDKRREKRLKDGQMD